MFDGRMIVIGEKESFIARVLIQKVKGTGAECDFVRWTVNDINANIDNVALITLFVEDGERPDEDVIHFLSDVMKEKDLQMILVGGETEIQYIKGHVPGELIYTTFVRPVDNMKFAETVTEYFKKSAAGEFKKSILVVDDDPQYLTMVRQWLKDTYNVSMANSGLQAIKWLGNNKVDLILLDHEMPVTSGPRVLEMLRSEEETRSIPVIFLTGKGDKESVMEVVSLKPEGYLLKGIQKEELMEKLDEFFILHK